MGWKIADLARDPTPSHHRESTDTLDRSLGVLVAPGSSRQGVGNLHVSSNFAASHYMSHR